MHFVSVIIPTYHDWERLKICIDALTKQTYPQDKFEVIIVNNDPEDSPPKFNLPDNFRIISEGKPGSYAARNTGIKEAKGEILAFTDSDCIPNHDWIEKAVSYLSDFDRIAGKVELFFKGNKLTIAEDYEKIFAFNQQYYSSIGGGVTANMITKKYYFDLVGLFNDNLMSGGDIEWGKRAANKGIKIKYCSDVIISHPARNQLSEILKKKKRTARGWVKSINLERHDILKLIVRMIFPPLSKISKIISSSELGNARKIQLSLFTYYCKVYKSFYKVTYFFLK